MGKGKQWGLGAEPTWEEAHQQGVCVSGRWILIIEKRKQIKIYSKDKGTFGSRNRYVC